MKTFRDTASPLHACFPLDPKLGYGVVMRRSRTVSLVLLAGGVTLSLAGGCESRQAQLQRECAEARTQQRPDAEQICARSVSSTHRSTGAHSWWFFGRSSGDARTSSSFAGRSTATTPGSSTRGGFGSTASSRGGASS